MSDEIHPQSRRESPVPPAERPRRTVPLDASLPDVCVHQKTCFALYVQSDGGMGWRLAGLAFRWALYGIWWWAGVIWWWRLPGLVLMLAVTLPLLLVSSVMNRRRGHRGWCWSLRSLDLEESIPDVLDPFVWILWPFRRLWRLSVWVWGLLSVLGDL